MSKTPKGKNDECFTPRIGVEALLEFLPPFKDKIIWCPFDTEESEFVKVFQENCFNVIYSHIDYGQDYYFYEPEKWDVMISNPPFTNKRKIFERALSFKKPFCLLMNMDWLRDKAPFEVFEGKRLELLMFKERMEFENQEQKKISFKTIYFGHNFFPEKLIRKSLRNRNQMKLSLTGV